MKSFLTIFRYEFKTQLLKKAAIVTMIVNMVILLVVTSLPRIIALFEKGKEEGPAVASGIEKAGFVRAEGQAQQLLLSILGKDAPSYPDREALAAALAKKEIEVGFVLDQDLNYEALYQDKSMYDQRDQTFAGLITQYKKEQLILSHGLSQEDFQSIEAATAQGQTTILGQNSLNNYFITFGLMLMVYFIILIHGSNVSSVIAREKDSRTMEILVTSARPSWLIIGKVTAAGLAAVVQFGLVVVVGLIGFHLNKSTFPPMVLAMVSGSITLPYVLTYLFFSFFGFILYLFLYAGLGSTVSKMEDLASATGLVQFLFIASYLLATLTAQMPNSTVAVVGSIIPFSSIMVMPMRSAMVTVPWGQMALAAVLMLIFVAFFAFLSIKIYRWGSLNYGNKTKFSRILKEALRREAR